jgi:hemerythrin-like domain-containing protein
MSRSAHAELKPVAATRWPGALPAADFDHPLEMLAACHERIEDRIETLHRLRIHLPQHGCDEQARQAAVNVMRYFDTAGEHHHDDEERDLFPALTAAAQGASELRSLIERLESEHSMMRTLWRRLRTELEAIAAGASAQLDARLVEDFSSLYRSHIALEESQLLPAAERVLDAAEKERLGAAMAARRGVAR